MLLKIGSERFTVANLADASAVYCRERDASGLGASGFANGRVVDERGKFVGRVSYNGHVWASRKYTPGEQPLI